MKKNLISLGILFFVANIATGQDVVPTTATPAPSASATPGTATAEEVVVTSQELDISREQIVPSLGATRYTVGPDRLALVSRERAV